MSVYYARGGSKGIGVTHGFFDMDPEIVLIQGSEEPLDPSVVVEHELTHVSLADNSALGWIEQGLTTLHLFMILPKFRDGVALATDVRRACLERLYCLRAATGLVHEAVAWFGTEEATVGREDQIAPAEYRKTIATLRNTLSTISGLAPPGTEQYFHDALHIGEALGIVALSPGNFEDLLAATFGIDDALALDRLSELLRQRDIAPTERFVYLCEQIQGADRNAAMEWGNRVYSRGSDNPIELLPSKPTGTRRIEFTTYPSAQELVARALHSYVESRVLANVQGSLPDLDQFWANSMVRGRFQREIDRYSQTCVLGAGLLGGKDLQVSSAVGETPPPELLLSSVMVVSRAVSDGDDRIGWQRSGPAGLVALFGVRIAAHFPWLGTTENSLTRWVTDLDHAGSFLRDVAHAHMPIVVIGVGYDQAVGDFENASLLRDLPHLVFHIGSFWRWWYTVAWDSPPGIGGCVDFEWLPMRSPGDDESPFGYIVIKPIDIPWPIVMIPTCIDKVDRVVSVADAMPSPYGVTFNVADGHPSEWLGALAKFPSAGAQAYEAVSC